MVAWSKGSPSLVVLTRLTMRSTNSSWMCFSTNSRLPAQQHWPWLKNRAKWAPATAASMSASAKTMLGLLPPSSSVTRLRFVSAAARMTSLPTSVLPVKATLSTSMWLAMAAPAAP